MSVGNAEAIRKGHELNIPSLEAYLKASVKGFGGKLESVLQFKSGQSNPTFYLKDNAGREYVLRKKPSGQILPSAVRSKRGSLTMVTSLALADSQLGDVLTGQTVRI